MSLCLCLSIYPSPISTVLPSHFIFSSENHAPFHSSSHPLSHSLILLPSPIPTLLDHHGHRHTISLPLPLPTLSSCHLLLSVSRIGTSHPLTLLSRGTRTTSSTFPHIAESGRDKFSLPRQFRHARGTQAESGVGGCACVCA